MSIAQGIAYTMTIKVNFIDNGKGVEILASGVVTGKELIAAHKEIYTPDKLEAQKYHIIDKSECSEYDVTSKDIEAIGEIDRQAAKINPYIIMAIIESKFLQFSLSEVWQAYVETYIQHTASFFNREDAIRWIENTLKKDS